VNNREMEHAIGEIGGNRFDLVNAVTQRAHQLERGSPPRVISQSSKAVSVAIAEVARGETGFADAEPTRTPSGRRGDFAEISCALCARLVLIRRKPGIAPQGRAPTRCALHGLSSNWYEVTLQSIEV
jgi:DNA-directed RNA polymerase subunit K/omega